MKLPRLLSFPAVLTVLISAADAKNPFLSPAFSSHMVLQRDREDPIWGWTEPGTKVAVEIGGKSVTATAGADGKWLVKLPSMPAGGPFQVTISGPEPVVLDDVLFGDVWICSGQSNMQFPLGQAMDAPQEIAAATHPEIRLMTVPNTISTVPKETFEGSGWKVCSPETAAGFSAVGYFFGRDLNRTLNVPIGLIHSSWGGTIAEAWTSAEALAPLGDFNDAIARLPKSAPDPAQLRKKTRQWFQRNDKGTPAWAAADFDDSAWPEMRQPQEWSGSGVAALTGLDGVVWLRKSFDLPAAGDQPATLLLGMIDDDDATWINGKHVGATSGFGKSRSYKVPPGVLKAGKNTIAVRVLDTSGNGGMTGPAEAMKLEIPGAEAVELGGAWRYAIGADLAKCPPLPARPSPNPNVPTVLYNAMISPLVPTGIKGAIWYQGESNAGRAKQYRRLLPALIGDWRARFGQGDFPFYIVQLANFQQRQDQPGESDWAELREAQAMTAATVPNSGLALAIDIGAENDIHPTNKQEVGRRLALVALERTYGEATISSGPVFASARQDGGAMRVKFTATGGGLVAKGGELHGFAIAGEDRKFVNAKAEIAGDEVVISSPEVPQPTAVRYGWAKNPNATLYNKADLPAVPFRTDDWPGMTDGAK